MNVRNKDRAIIDWIYLALAVAFLSGLSLSMKLGGRQGVSTFGLVALACGIGTLLISGYLAFTLQAGTFPAVVTRWGIISGVFGTIGFLCLVRAMKIGPYGFTVAVQPMSFLIPVLFAFFFWKEGIGPWQSAGIGLIFLGLFLIFVLGDSAGRDGKSRKRTAWITLLVLTLVLQGIPQIAQATVSRSHKDGLFVPFLFVAYLTGTLLVALPALRERTFVRRAIPYAAAGGLCGVLGNFCMLKAFKALPVCVVSPIALAAPVMMALVLSHFWFHERITRTGYLGILAGTAGVYLLSRK
jgi:drug/metabolite transporter (DMT)-like permease